MYISCKMVSGNTKYGYIELLAPGTRPMMNKTIEKSDKYKQCCHPGCPAERRNLEARSERHGKKEIRVHDSGANPCGAGLRFTST